MKVTIKRMNPDEVRPIDIVFKNYLGRTTTVRELENALNEATQPIENDFEAFCGEEELDFIEQLRESSYLSYVVSDDEIGTIDFKLIKLDSKEPYNSIIKVTGF